MKLRTVLILCGAVLGCGVGAVCIYVAAMVWFFGGMLDGVHLLTDDSNNPARSEHLRRANELDSAGDIDGAIAEWRLAIDEGFQGWAAQPLAESLTKRGRFDEALAVVDRNAEWMSWPSCFSARTRVLQHWKRADAAAVWMRELDAQDPTSPLWFEQRGSRHVDEGRPAAALEPLLESVATTCKLHVCRFDERDQLVDGAPPPTQLSDFETRMRLANEFAALAPASTALAKAYDQLGDDPNALQWATRLVSVHQQMNALHGGLDPGEVEAGSCWGRLMRAGVLTRRGDLDAASIELDHAARTKGGAAYYRYELKVARSRIEKLRSASK